MSNKETIVKMVLDKKMSLKEVASKLKITENQLKFLLNAWGVELPRRAYKKIPMPDRDTLLMMYERHKSTQKVGEVMGVGTNTVARWMKARKIPTRRLAKMSQEEKLELLEYHIDTQKI